jgi:hypothetical protein
MAFIFPSAPCCEEDLRYSVIYHGMSIPPLFTTVAPYKSPSYTARARLNKRLSTFLLMWAEFIQ